MEGGSRRILSQDSYAPYTPSDLISDVLLLTGHSGLKGRLGSGVVWTVDLRRRTYKSVQTVLPVGQLMS